MKNFNYSKRDFTSGPHLLGIFMLIVGLFTLLSPYIIGTFVSPLKIWIVGIGTFILGLVITQSFNGILIDTNANRLLEYFSFFGYRMGKWKAFPEVRSIRIKKTTRIQSNTSNGISPTLSGRIFYVDVLLLNEHSETILKLRYSKEQKANTKANELASGFNVALI